ncbi:M28 family peptidase [Gordonia aurantiaca]|uniref:M28 family peptidase n=1 Tax=Gordonia sp. B21 TaxID=3151852 RepID=UPI0032641629
MTLRPPRCRSTLRLPAVAVLATALVAGCATVEPDSPTRSSSAPIAAPPSLPPVSEVTPDGLADAVTVDRMMGHLRSFQQIADDHGGNRATGTAGHDASVDLVAGQLREAGFEVSTPEFSYTRYDLDKVRFAADGHDVKGHVVEYSVGTRGPVTARPVSVRALGCAPTDFPAGVRGNLAMITRGECTFADKARNAQSAGAVGVVIVNNEDGPPFGLTLDPEDVPGIPVLAVAREDADRVRSARDLRLEVDAKTVPITTRNVIAETRTGSPDDVVMAGAHLDSVAAGPGINDNATGTAAVLETALRLGASPPVPHRVRFAFWGGEEDGLLGSTEYVRGLDEAQRRAIALYLNFDMLGSPNGGYFTYDGDDSARDGAGAGPAGSEGIERVFTRYFDERKIPVGQTDFDGRSDYGPFIAVGIPSGGVLAGAEHEKTAEQARMWSGEAGKPFDPNYHSRRDTIDNVNADLLAVHSSAVAYAVATYALSTTGPDGVPAVGARERAEGYRSE